MAIIEITSGLQTIITPSLHYHFHWMGDHWKQEIHSIGGCESIPKIWSVEGLVSQFGQISPASPSFQHLKIDHSRPDHTVVELEGRSDSIRFRGTFEIEERLNETIMHVELRKSDTVTPVPLTATYLVESSDGRLVKDGSATMSWLNPQTRLIFEADPPARIESQASGLGTIRLKAILDAPSPTEQTLSYRWKWLIVPTHQIWDREV